MLSRLDSQALRGRKNSGCQGLGLGDKCLWMDGGDDCRTRMCLMEQICALKKD